MSELLEKHPVFEKIFQERRRSVLKELGPFLGANGQYNLSFWPYVNTCPIQFYSREVAKLSFDYLNGLISSDKQQALEVFRETLPEFELAFRILNEVNLQKENDELVPMQHEAKIQLIDEFINYNYLRLVEGVLAKFLKPFAIHFRLLRQAKLDGMDIYQMIEELKGSNLMPLIASYDHVIRNGIGHSHVTYRNQDITYKDKKGTSRSISTDEMIRLFDSLLDICNGLALSYQAFLLSQRYDFESSNLLLPRSLIFKVAAEELNSDFWKITMVMDSVTYDNRSQLMIFIRNQLISETAVRYYVFRTFYHIQKILPGFDRYFLSLRSKYSKTESGWSALNGNKYTDLIERNHTAEAAIGTALEDGIIFFLKKFPFSTLFAKFHARWLAYSTNWKLFRSESSKIRNGFFLDFRSISFHRSRFSMIFKAVVVIQTESDVRKCIDYGYQRILKLTKKHIHKQIPVYSIWRYLPISFFMITIFNRNFRKRTLVNSGLIPELIARLLIKKRTNVVFPDLINSEVVQRGSVRINWNRN